jgi:effector-binding domain-containing protein
LVSEKERPPVERLLRFIADQAYVIVGPHEEEYLRGPGMAANPADYWTIIRYQVKKK